MSEYVPSGAPALRAFGSSEAIRQEFLRVAAHLGSLPEPSATGRGMKNGVLENFTLQGGRAGIATNPVLVDARIITMRGNTPDAQMGANNIGLCRTTEPTQMRVVANLLTSMIFGVNRDVVVGNGSSALATTADDGLFYIPRMAGTPTGDPDGYGSSVPLVYDSSAHKLWVRHGSSWRGVTLS